jgi:hypothetical protein
MDLENKSIRLNALMNMRWTFGLLIFAFSAMILLDLYFKQVIQIIGRFIIIPMAFLCLPFMINCIELISGKNISTYYSKWNDLKGWQRGVFGFIIVFVSLSMIFYICFTIAINI